MSVLHTFRQVWQGSRTRSEHALDLPDCLAPPPGHGDFLLRPIREDDQAAWNAVRWKNREWLAPWESGDPCHGPGMTYVQWMQQLERDRQEGTEAVFLMEFHQSIVGQISLGAICYGSMRMATAGYWVDEDWTGHGFAPLALAMLADWAFRNESGPHLHRIEVAILPENERSLRVVQKLGMESEGLRRSYMYVNGQWRDHLTFALISDQFDPDLLASL